MLKAAISYENVFARYLDEDLMYAIDLSQEKGGPWYPNEQDWENAKNMAEFLGHFFISPNAFLVLYMSLHTTSFLRLVKSTS
jgi:hypothetical protein